MAIPQTLAVHLSSSVNNASSYRGALGKIKTNQREQMTKVETVTPPSMHLHGKGLICVTFGRRMRETVVQLVLRKTNDGS